MIIFHVWTIFACLIIVMCNGHLEAAESSSCGDWISFKDEKCFKLIDDTMRTFDEAGKTCAKLEDSPTLSIIRSKEEQDLLSNYVFKTLKKVENVWIGALFSNNKFHWIDNTDLSYTNWVTKGTKNKTNYCVQLDAEEDSVGKWIDEPCEKKGFVVCQKLQSWTTYRLQKILLDVRKEFRDSQDASNKVIADLKHNLDEANKKIDEANKKISDNKQTLVPIGFIYPQLPNEKSPAEIWPWMKWTDMSSNYSGIFFRVNGGDAAAFGQIQEENAPRLAKTFTGNAPEVQTKTPTKPWAAECPISKTGWSGGIPTGSGCCDNTAFTAFEFSGGEIRPRNMAFRVWKRTG